VVARANDLAASVGPRHAARTALPRPADYCRAPVSPGLTGGRSRHRQFVPSAHITVAHRWLAPANWLKHPHCAATKMTVATSSGGPFRRMANLELDAGC